MNKLQELHKEIIEFTTYTDIDKFGDSHVKGINKASEESSELTKDLCIRFTEWLTSYYHFNGQGWVAISLNSDIVKSEEELFNLFIEENMLNKWLLS